jgi:hypothetical protein
VTGVAGFFLRSTKIHSPVECAGMGLYTRDFHLLPQGWEIPSAQIVPTLKDRIGPTVPRAGKYGEYRRRKILPLRAGLTPHAATHHPIHRTVRRDGFHSAEPKRTATIRVGGSEAWNANRQRRSTTRKREGWVSTDNQSNPRDEQHYLLSLERVREERRQQAARSGSSLGSATLRPVKYRTIRRRTLEEEPLDYQALRTSNGQWRGTLSS